MALALALALALFATQKNDVPYAPHSLGASGIICSNSRLKKQRGRLKKQRGLLAK